MELLQRVVVGPKGRFEGEAPGVEPGTMLEIVVKMPDAHRPDDEGWERHWATSDRLIAEGMETWDIDRVNEEVAERRYGGRKRY